MRKDQKDLKAFAGVVLSSMTEEERQALKRKLKRAVRGPKEAKRQAKVADRAKSFWDV